MTTFRFGVVRIDWLKPVLVPEGLVVTKLVAFRPQDQEDIPMLLAANRETIDRDHERTRRDDISR